ncbi:hypothetical protein DEO72_LG9g1763 [Vigna unguiculata]|uniref:Uncharacterized protein n=1 Tax=Vigna unguiculata TaxID=3917 RepID=A0A4D6N2K9_VIGUN|nr:hypothetical protein DEO72_LG9g1763 [Vigna unguiculata]
MAAAAAISSQATTNLQQRRHHHLPPHSRRHHYSSCFAPPRRNQQPPRALPQPRHSTSTNTIFFVHTAAAIAAAQLAGDPTTISETSTPPSSLHLAHSMAAPPFAHQQPESRTIAQLPSSRELPPSLQLSARDCNHQAVKSRSTALPASIQEAMTVPSRSHHEQ